MKIEYSYMTTKERNLLYKQSKFPKLTQKVFIQPNEVKTYDGYSLVEPMLQASDEPPHELHLIKKVGKLIGEPWWVKKAMRELGFKTFMTKEWQVIYNVQPNVPKINKCLWLCKHLVKITPIKFKNDYKPTVDDIGYTRLNLATGELEVIEKLKHFDIDNISCYKLNGVTVTSDLAQSDTFGLTKDNLRKHMQRKRELCLLNDEYFPTDYDYKYDQQLPGVIKLPGRPDTSVKEDEVEDE
jgi:hypothetical protein